MWFKELFGFEESAHNIRKYMECSGTRLISKANGRTFRCGSLAIPTLAELRQQVNRLPDKGEKSVLSEVVADAKALHADSANAGALFQVASQFNLLEMVSPQVTPEAGISGYATDMTQGPACAMAAAAGTLFRNYFVKINGAVGQTAENQIDCLSDIGEALENREHAFWQMRNGYAMLEYDKLERLKEMLGSIPDEKLDTLRGALRIGIQQDTEVTLDGASHCVSQAYCSALPVGYHGFPVEMWQPFAQLILDASYEATLCVAILNANKSGNNKVFLTLVGGGVFGNRQEWILKAVERALSLYPKWGLDIRMVSYGTSNPRVQQLINKVST